MPASPAGPPGKPKAGTPIVPSAHAPTSQAPKPRLMLPGKHAAPSTAASAHTAASPSKSASAAAKNAPPVLSPVQQYRQSVHAIVKGSLLSKVKDVKWTGTEAGWAAARDAEKKWLRGKDGPIWSINLPADGSAPPPPESRILDIKRQINAHRRPLGLPLLDLPTPPPDRQPTPPATASLPTPAKEKELDELFEEVPPPPAPLREPTPAPAVARPRPASPARGERSTSYHVEEVDGKMILTLEDSPEPDDREVASPLRSTASPPPKRSPTVARLPQEPGFLNPFAEQVFAGASVPAPVPSAAPVATSRREPPPPPAPNPSSLAGQPEWPPLEFRSVKYNNSTSPVLPSASSAAPILSASPPAPAQRPPALPQARVGPAQQQQQQYAQQHAQHQQRQQESPFQLNNPYIAPPVAQGPSPVVFGGAPTTSYAGQTYAATDGVPYMPVYSLPSTSNSYPTTAPTQAPQLATRRSSQPTATVPPTQAPPLARNQSQPQRRPELVSPQIQQAALQAQRGPRQRQASGGPSVHQRKSSGSSADASGQQRREPHTASPHQSQSSPTFAQAQAVAQHQIQSSQAFAQQPPQRFVATQHPTALDSYGRIPVEQTDLYWKRVQEFRRLDEEIGVVAKQLADGVDWFNGTMITFSPAYKNELQARQSKLQAERGQLFELCQSFMHTWTVDRIDHDCAVRRSLSQSTSAAPPTQRARPTTSSAQQQRPSNPVPPSQPHSDFQPRMIIPAAVATPTPTRFTSLIQGAIHNAPSLPVTSWAELPDCIDGPYRTNISIDGAPISPGIAERFWLALDCSNSFQGMKHSGDLVFRHGVQRQSWTADGNGHRRALKFLDQMYLEWKANKGYVLEGTFTELVECQQPARVSLPLPEPTPALRATALAISHSAGASQQQQHHPQQQQPSHQQPPAPDLIPLAEMQAHQRNVATYFTLQPQVEGLYKRLSTSGAMLTQQQRISEQSEFTEKSAQLRDLANDMNSFVRHWTQDKIDCDWDSYTANAGRPLSSSSSSSNAAAAAAIAPFSRSLGASASPSPHSPHQATFTSVRPSPLSSSTGPAAPPPRQRSVSSRSAHASPQNQSIATFPASQSNSGPDLMRRTLSRSAGTSTPRPPSAGAASPSALQQAFRNFDSQYPLGTITPHQPPPTNHPPPRPSSTTPSSATHSHQVPQQSTVGDFVHQAAFANPTPFVPALAIPFPAPAPTPSPAPTPTPVPTPSQPPLDPHIQTRIDQAHLARVAESNAQRIAAEHDERAKQAAAAAQERERKAAEEAEAAERAKEAKNLELLKDLAKNQDFMDALQVLSSSADSFKRIQDEWERSEAVRKFNFEGGPEPAS